jgi:hypothetical protein
VQARHELVIFLEHFPYVLQPWLVEHQERLTETLDELRATIDFLRTHGVIHFDAHYANIVTDAGRPYLTDFGLASDRDFELDDREREFFDDHTHYDYGEVLWNLGYLLPAIYNGLPDDDKTTIRAKIGMADAGPLADRLLPLVDNIEAIADDQTLHLHENLVAAVVRYRDVIMLVQEFFVALRANLRKDTPYPHTALRRLLRDAEFAD